MTDPTDTMNSMERVILFRLAGRLGASKKGDDVYKFGSVSDMLLFLDIANRLKHIEVSEDYTLMSVLITPMPRQIDEHADELTERIQEQFDKLDKEIEKEKRLWAALERRIEHRS